MIFIRRLEVRTDGDRSESSPGNSPQPASRPVRTSRVPSARHRRSSDRSHPRIRDGGHPFRSRRDRACTVPRCGQRSLPCGSDLISNCSPLSFASWSVPALSVSTTPTMRARGASSRARRLSSDAHCRGHGQVRWRATRSVGRTSGRGGDPASARENTGPLYDLFPKVTQRG